MRRELVAPLDVREVRGPGDDDKHTLRDRGMERLAQRGRCRLVPLAGNDQGGRANGAGIDSEVRIAQGATYPATGVWSSISPRSRVTFG